MEPTGAIRANAGNSYNSGNKFVVSQVFATVSIVIIN